MVAVNDAPLGTAFTVSVDVRHGLTTGISAEQRTNTVRALANRNMGASDFVRPGHVFPLIAKDGGVLMRSGHTEAAIDLCKLAGLPPVAVICELANDDGTVMVGPRDRGLRGQAQDQAHFRRRHDRLPAGAREAGRAGRLLSDSRRRSASFRATPIAPRSIRSCILLSFTGASATGATSRRGCIALISLAIFSARGPSPKF